MLQKQVLFGSNLFFFSFLFSHFSNLFGSILLDWKKNQAFSPTTEGELPVTPIDDPNTSSTFIAFLSHNWGRDTEGRDNHKRVLRFKNQLLIEGIENLWLDEEMMTGNIVRQMSTGIHQSKVVIVFITQRYINKVAGQGAARDNDNCLLEFDYARRKKGSSKMIAVVMEEGCSDQNN